MSVAVGLSACGRQSQCQVQGRITIGKNDLEKGSILFIPLAGTAGMVSGGLIERGWYRVTSGLRPGDYRVEIRCPRLVEKSIRGISPSYEGPDAKAYEESVAEHFNSQSTIRVTLSAGRNVQDFQVASKPDL